MGRRGGRAVAACALGALALVAAGCGAEERTSEARPQPPTRVSVAVSDDAVSVQPRRVGVGQEPTQQIPQNRNAGQPRIDSDTPLDVVLVAANLTDTDSRLEVRGEGREATSRPLVANGNISMQASLPAGVYTVTAADIPGAEPGRLVVGDYRTSSENDILLP